MHPLYPKPCSGFNQSVSFTNPDSMTNFVQQGWQCPVCKSVMAPYQPYCLCCYDKAQNPVFTVKQHEFGTDPYSSGHYSQKPDPSISVNAQERQEMLKATNQFVSTYSDLQSSGKIEYPKGVDPIISVHEDEVGQEVDHNRHCTAESLNPNVGEHWSHGVNFPKGVDPQSCTFSRPQDGYTLTQSEREAFFSEPK